MATKFKQLKQLTGAEDFNPADRVTKYVRVLQLVSDDRLSCEYCHKRGLLVVGHEDRTLTIDTSANVARVGGKSYLLPRYEWWPRALWVCKQLGLEVDN